MGKGEGREENDVASSTQGTLVMGRIQSISLAHPRIVLAENSAATFERCDICHSIKNGNLPMVCEPDSPGLPTTSEALGGAGGVGHSYSSEVPSRI